MFASGAPAAAEVQGSSRFSGCAGGHGPHPAQPGGCQPPDILRRAATGVCARLHNQLYSLLRACTGTLEGNLNPGLYLRSARSLGDFEASVCFDVRASYGPNMSDFLKVLPSPL